MIITAKSGWGWPRWKELWEFRDLFWLLVQRDLKLKYKQTAIGIGWVLLQPFATALLFSLLFGYFARFSVPGTSYLLYAFTGMLAWILFSQIMTRASTSLLNDARLISKVYFPRFLVPLASSTAVLVDFFTALGFLALLKLSFGSGWGWEAFLVLPILCLEMLFAASLGALLAAWNVHYRDFVHVVPFLLQLWMFATPLFYPLSLIPEKWQGLYALNPLVGIAEGLRWALLGTGPFPAASLAMAALLSFFMFAIGALLFERLERRFADVI